MKVFWKCFSPYIDAYYTSENRSYKKVSKKEALADLKNSMDSIAKDWGTESIGESVLKNNEPNKVNSKFVFCCGYFYYDSGKTEVRQKYVLVGGHQGPYGEDVEIVEFDYPNDWDVT